MTVQHASGRAAGWSLAGAAAVALLGTAAWALVAERPRPEPLYLNLGALPSAAPTVAAVAEAAPQVVDEAPSSEEQPAPPETAAEVPEEVTPPKAPAAARMSVPEPEVPVTAELALPPAREKPVPAEPEANTAAASVEPEPEPKPVKKKAPDKPKAKPKEVANEAVASKPAAAAGASAPRAGSKLKGGSVSPAAYAKAVMKQVRSTRKQGGAGKGTVVVGFSIAADGGLAGVQVLQTSGNAALDRIALDHILRSAPFPAPPEGVRRGYSFEFVGK